VGRVTALAAAGFQQPLRLGNGEDGIEEATLGAVGQQPSAEFTQDRMVKAEVGKLQTEQLLPVDARANRVSCLAVGHAFPELEQGDQGEANRRLRRLTLRGKNISEVAITEQQAQLVVHPHDQVALRKDGTRNAGGVFRDTGERLWLK
jgi:hypothetical protein